MKTDKIVLKHIILSLKFRARTIAKRQTSNKVEMSQEIRNLCIEISCEIRFHKVQTFCITMNSKC